MQTHTHHADDPALLTTLGYKCHVCAKCGKPAAPEAKLLFCGGCRSAGLRYC
jgi:hypothetical protein